MYGGAAIDGDSFCDFSAHQRILRDWNFGEDKEGKELGRLGAETYRTFSASSDGKTVFGYAGMESYCQLCNQGLGETKVSDARFRIWDRVSGSLIAESPSVDVEKHSCFLAIGPGSCTAYERVPEMEMSDDGKAVLVYMPLSWDDTPDRKPRNLIVYRLR